MISLCVNNKYNIRSQIREQKKNKKNEWRGERAKCFQAAKTLPDTKAQYIPSIYTFTCI